MDYFELDPEHNIFKTLSIQTTYKCQMKCSNCYLGSMLNDESIADVDIVQLTTLLSKLPSRCDIRFIGAEPTMNPFLVDLIRAARRCGHRPSLLTNGIKLRDEQYVVSLKQAGLNMLGLSMNGGLDDEVYKQFDGGKYAKVKAQALNNCFKHKILPHVNLILDPTNIHVVEPLIDFITSTALSNGIAFSPRKFPVALRIKSIGQMGNYRKTKTLSMSKMVEIMSDVHKQKIEIDSTVDGYCEHHSVMYKFETEAGTMLGKITDWSVDDDGVPDAGSKRRGIITDNYKIAPFFEYYVRQHNDRLL